MTRLLLGPTTTTLTGNDLIDGDSTHFDIDPATGQISVAPGAMLDLMGDTQERNVHTPQTA